MGLAYKYHERQEKILSKSKLNWTILQPVGLSNSKREEKIGESFENFKP
ncbi:NAD(P)H-binding protein [Robiginitalea sp.]